MRFKFNAYIFTIVMVSLTAIATSGLLFLLLPGPDEIIRRMQSKMVQLKGYKVLATGTYDGARKFRDENYVLTKEAQGIDFEVRGSVNKFDEEDARFLHDVLFTFSGEEIDEESEVVSETEDVEFNGQLRRVAGNDYAWFREMPDRLGVVEIGKLRGDWLRYELDTLREAIDAPLLGSTGRELEISEKIEILQRVAITPFFSFVGREEDEVMHDEEVFHYVVMPEPLFFKDFLIRREVLRLGRELTVREVFAVETFFSDIKPLRSELYIGKQTKYLHQLVLRFAYGNAKREGQVEMLFAFSDFNNELEIQVPEGKVRDVNKLLASLLPGIASTLPLAQEGEVQLVMFEDKEHIGLPVDVVNLNEADADGDGLSDALEFFYGSNQNNPDSDGDGVNDGDEVASGMNPMGPGRLFSFGLDFDTPYEKEEEEDGEGGISNNQGFDLEEEEEEKVEASANEGGSEEEMREDEEVIEDVEEEAEEVPEDSGGEEEVSETIQEEGVEVPEDEAAVEGLGVEE